jgi:Uma2 family endonuclease
VSTRPKTFLTPEQYLEIERKAQSKSEYYDGEMFAMAGAQEAHNLIVLNLGAELRSQLRLRGCRAYVSDMRVHVGETGLYTYPDVTALCGERKFLDADVDTLLNPTLIVEVLSPSTEAYDRGPKFSHYQTIESLRDYLLVSSERVQVDLFTRQADGRWLLTTVTDISESIAIESLVCRLALADIYDLVEVRSRTPDQHPSAPKSRQA